MKKTIFLYPPLAVGALTALIVTYMILVSAAAQPKASGRTATSTAEKAAIAPSVTSTSTAPSPKHEKPAPVSYTMTSVLDSKITSQNVFDLVNNQRIAAGLKPLRVNDELTDAAKMHAEDMVLHGYFAHTTSDGKNYNEYIDASGYVRAWSGENLAQKFDTVQEVVDGWMASPGHKANILKPEYTDTGIWIANGIVVQIFASKQGV